MTETIKEHFKSSAFTAPLLIIFVLVSMQLSKFALPNLENETNIFVAIGVVQLVAIGLPCIIYYLLKGRKLNQPIYIISNRGPQLLFVLFAALTFVSGMLLIKFFYFIGGGTNAAIVNFYGDVSSNTANTAGHLEIILSLIVIPAVLEEILFRGILFSEYRAFGTANAVIISALCFAMLHFSIENFFMYLFAGLIFGFATAITRSIFASIALHLLSNTLSIYASDAFLRITVVKNGSYFVGFVLVVFLALSLILLLSRVETICNSYAEKPPVEEMPPNSKSNWAKVFFSPSFFLLIISFLIIVLFI